MVILKYKHYKLIENSNFSGKVYSYYDSHSNNTKSFIFNFLKNNISHRFFGPSNIQIYFYFKESAPEIKKDYYFNNKFINQSIKLSNNSYYKHYLYSQFRKDVNKLWLS